MAAIGSGIKLWREVRREGGGILGGGKIVRNMKSGDDIPFQLVISPLSDGVVQKGSVGRVEVVCGPIVVFKAPPENAVFVENDWKFKVILGDGPLHPFGTSGEIKFG